MTVYALAQFTVHDRQRYDRYAARFMEVLAGFDGRLLAADERVTVVEGDWGFDKAVLIAFPDAAAFRAWADSDAYTAIARDRIAATTGSVVLVAGLRPSRAAAPATG